VKEVFGWCPKESEIEKHLDPSCHSCGAPIVLGKPVAVYHQQCDPLMHDNLDVDDAATKDELESLLWMLGEYAATWRDAAKSPNSSNYRGKWVYEDCAQEIEDLIEEYRGE
jgi:hypothetical protein